MERAYFTNDLPAKASISKHSAIITYSDFSGWDRSQDGEISNDRNGKSGELSHFSDVIDVCTCIHNSGNLHVSVCGSAHCCVRVVNGNVAMVAC